MRCSDARCREGRRTRRWLDLKREPRKVVTNVTAEAIDAGVGLTDAPTPERSPYLVLPKDDSQKAVEMIFEAARELGLEVPDLDDE
jgi:hypothetical protein